MDELNMANCFCPAHLTFLHLFIFHVRLLEWQIDDVIVCHFPLPESTKKLIDGKGVVCGVG
jgi:hypothetical protein